MEKEGDHITPLLPEAIEKLQRVLIWGASLTGELRTWKAFRSGTGVDMKNRRKRVKTKKLSSENDSYLIRIKKGERLYKFFYFRPVAGRHYHFEYRILTKEKINGMLEMVSYNFKIENGVPKKSSITKVPKISKEQLEEIIQNVRMKTNTGPDEFEELDLSGFSTIDEQIEFLKRRNRVDTMYIM
jgi:hypothetical protein